MLVPLPFDFKMKSYNKKRKIKRKKKKTQTWQVCEHSSLIHLEFYNSNSKIGSKVK
jgi:hypothetical protein